MSRRGKPKRLPSVGELLPRVTRRLRLDGAVQEKLVLDGWRRVVGDKVARHTEALSLERGVLTVLVDSPAWLTQLTYLKPELIRKLAPTVKKGALRDVRFRLGRPGGSRDD